MAHTERMKRLIDHDDESIRYLAGQVSGLQLILAFTLSSLTKDDDRLRGSIRTALDEWATTWGEQADAISEGDSGKQFAYGVHRSFVDVAGCLVDPEELDLFGEISSVFDALGDFHSS